ncbi:MAG: hypothetical protein QOE90_2012 [Thermoplasmata archaeon]|jgi:hypothetical protein|nr:hypothetical protein [Thermoplasmata archaeon]
MRALLLSLVLVAGVAAFALPGASAFSDCTSVTGNCDGWFVCLNAQRDANGQLTCDVGVQNPPPCACLPQN